MRPQAGRCAHCGARTSVHPGQVMRAVEGRWPHSPLRLKGDRLPLCALARATRSA